MNSVLTNNRLIQYLSTACTSTGQATFYNTREEQAAALAELHCGVLTEDRRAYMLSAVLPINDRNRQEIVYNLIASGERSTDRELENQVIQYVTRELPFSRSLKLLVRLCRAKVNNARLRRVCREFWSQHGDAYRAVKYRSKYRIVLRHCHIGEGSDPVQAEVHRWIFGRLRNADDVQYNEVLRSRLMAVKDLEACFQLPLEIGRDIAVSQHGVKPTEFTEQFAGKSGTETAAAIVAKGRVTRKQSLIANRQAGTQVDFERFGLIELLQHGYRVRDDRENPEAFAAIASELFAALDLQARKLARNLQLADNVHVIVDNSGSAHGSDERAYHALAVVEATARVLQAVAELNESSVTCHYVGAAGGKNELLTAAGATDLRRPLARALAARPDLVVILSDGYENVTAGGVAQILATRAVRESGIAVVHLNPVAAVEAAGVRKLADSLPTYGVAGPEQISISLLLGEAVVNPQRLIALFDRIENALKGDQNEIARIV